jgi:CRP-like cAMP-binding protein
MTKPKKASTRNREPFAIELIGMAARAVPVKAGSRIFAQGDPATSVMYIKTGMVRLSVLSGAGTEAVIALLGEGDFFGEGCLTGQPMRMATASALEASSIITIPKDAMVAQLTTRPAFGEQFLKHMLKRNIRIEADLIDQLFNSSEKRLARVLLLLARYGEPDASHRRLPRLSQETLAEMVGTTRSRVNFFMNKFRKLGFIEYNGDLKINNSLLSVVLRD